MNEYQVGGSLSVDASCYVKRKADDKLYKALLRGEFCYVFNSRQMGKSSLRVRVRNQLQKQGYACVSLDMTNIGSQTISPLQWYKGIVTELWRGLGLAKKVRLQDWWQKHQDLSLVQKLHFFVTDVILTEIEAEKIFIFIDEIDSVLSLDFSTDDFFALIRYFYNARAENDSLKRLSFALFGVATPRDLIQDNTRTPFNIGTAIELAGFTLSEATPLLSGLESKFAHPKIVLQEILQWTGGQPFLTQKLCNLVETYGTKDSSQTVETAAQWVKKLVRQKVIQNWEAQDKPEHFKTIRDRLLHNEALANRLLGLAEQILKNGFILADNSPEQTYLLLSNLVVKQDGKLRFRNLIYQEIFDSNWIHQQQEELRPFGREVKYWLASQGQDRSRLLRGNALQEAQAWANIHSISQEEYQFLTASQEQEQEQLRLDLELQRLQEVETRLKREHTLAKLQRFLLSTVGTALAVSTGLGIIAYFNYRQAKASAIAAKSSEIKAHTALATSLFNSGRSFESLLHAIMGSEEAKNFTELENSSRRNSRLALKQAAYNIVQKNIYSGHKGVVNSVAFSPDGNLIASASSDTTVKIWQRNGKLLATLQDHQDTVIDVAFNNDGKLIASAGEDRKIKLWNRNGQLITTLNGHQSSIYAVAFSPTENILASASGDQTVRLWNVKGELTNILLDHNRPVLAVAFSRDGQLLATGDRDGIIKIWTIKGQLLRSFVAHEAPVRAIDFNPQGTKIVTGGDDNRLQIWTIEGEVSKVCLGYDAPVTDVEFSPDGKIIATSSWDSTIKLWHADGTLKSNLKGHQGRVWRLAWSPDGTTIASGGWDNVVRLWQINNPLVKTFYGHTATVIDVAFNPQGTLIASASDDQTVKLWDLDGKIMTDFAQHQGEVYSVAFSQDGQLIASASLDRMIKIWNSKGQTIAKAQGHKAPIFDVIFRESDRSLVSASLDRTIRFWQLKDYQDSFTTVQKKKVFAHQAVIYDLDVSQDEQLIASASQDRYLKLWNAQGELLDSILADKIGLRTVSISPDKKLIATGGKENSVKIWNNKGQLTYVLPGHEAVVLDVEFSPDGSKIASASADRTIKIWTTTGKLLTTLKGHQGRVWSIKFSPDGSKIVSAGEDKTVKLWEVARILQLDELEYACNWVKDYLQTNTQKTEEETRLCQKFL